MRTWRDVYPCGRKFCSRCKHWRHGMDFPVRAWADEPQCTIPRTLASLCTGCMAEARREKNGYKRRDMYPHGKPGSRQWLEHRRKMNRESAARRRASEEYREDAEEYRRIWRNAKVGSVARLTINGDGASGFLDALGVLAYLDSHSREVESRDTRSYTELHGIRLDESDSHLFSKIRTGKQPLISFERADEIATRYDLPLWEIEESGEIKDVPTPHDDHSTPGQAQRDDLVLREPVRPDTHHDAARSQECHLV